MKEIYIVIDNIRSAYNVGSIFRTADAMGAKRILICGIAATPENPKVHKTALTATESIEWEYFSTTKDAVESLQKESIPIFSCEITKDSKSFWDIEFPDRLAIVFGHEVTGVASEILSLSDEIVHIPMKGKKESLNVATAAGILLYEVIKP